MQPFAEYANEYWQEIQAKQKTVEESFAKLVTWFGDDPEKISVADKTGIEAFFTILTRFEVELRNNVFPILIYCMCRFTDECLLANRQNQAQKDYTEKQKAKKEAEVKRKATIRERKASIQIDGGGGGRHRNRLVLNKGSRSTKGESSKPPKSGGLMSKLTQGMRNVSASRNNNGTSTAANTSGADSEMQNYLLRKQGSSDKKAKSNGGDHRRRGPRAGR